MKGNNQITRKQIIDTGLVFALACIFIYIKWEFTPGLWISIGLLSVLLVFPILLFPVAYYWFSLARVLSWLSSRVVLIIIFFLVVSPVALVRKLMGKDSLRLQAFKKSNASAYFKKNRKFKNADLKYPF